MIAPSAAGITFVAATGLEARALRREMPAARVVRAGIALERLDEELGDVVVSCGLAGGLRSGLATGTLLVPGEVLRPSGDLLRCDPQLAELFVRHARSYGIVAVRDPLLTAAEIVAGDARRGWGARGYAGVDMESGLIRAPRVAVVRVVLDTPERELSPEWRTPLAAMLKPWNWSQAFWLAREAPRAAALAARIAAAAQGA